MYIAPSVCEGPSGHWGEGEGPSRHRTTGEPEPPSSTGGLLYEYFEK